MFWSVSSDLILFVVTSDQIFLSLQKKKKNLSSVTINNYICIYQLFLVMGTESIFKWNIIVINVQSKLKLWIQDISLFSLFLLIT